MPRRSGSTPVSSNAPAAAAPRPPSNSNASLPDVGQQFKVGSVVKVGTRVKFVGTVTTAYGDGTYDIMYQDGKRDFDIPHALISSYTEEDRRARSPSTVSLGGSKIIDSIDIEDAVSDEWASIGDVVPAGSKLEIGPIKLPRAGALLEWKFAVLNGEDIEFCVLFSDGQHVPDMVVEEALYSGVGTGHWFFDEPGEAILRWSNFFSFISAKKVRYRIRMTFPDAGENARRRRQITTQLQQAREELRVRESASLSCAATRTVASIRCNAFRILISMFLSDTARTARHRSPKQRLESAAGARARCGQGLPSSFAAMHIVT